MWDINSNNSLTELSIKQLANPNIRWTTKLQTEDGEVIAAQYARQDALLSILAGKEPEHTYFIENHLAPKSINS